MPKKISVFERNPGKTLFFFSLALLLLVDFGAGSFRSRGMQVGVPSAYYHHALRPNAKGRAVWGDATHEIATNSLGFLDKAPREVPLEKTAGRERVVIIGDSFLQGVGVPPGETVAGIAAERLAKENIEVYNAALSSYSPRLYYLKTRWLIEKAGFKFDRLVVFIDVSDIQDELSYELFEPPEFAFEAAWRVNAFLKDHSVLFPFLMTKLKAGAALKTWFMKKGPLYSRWKDESVYYMERSLWLEREDMYRAWGERGLALAAGNMDRLSALCRERGIELTIGVYPWPPQIRSGNLKSRQAVFWEKFAREHGAGFDNYFPEFIGKAPPWKTISDYFIRGDMHWNSAGHRLVAESFLRRFAARRRKP